MRLYSVALVAAVAWVGCKPLHPELATSTAPPEVARTPAGELFTPVPALMPPPSPPVLKPGLRYLNQVGYPLQKKWSMFLEETRLTKPKSHPLNNMALEATLSISISADGSLEDISIISSSGVHDFDTAAEKIVLATAPFEPPPDFRLSEDGLLHLSWLFARDRRQAGVSDAFFRRIELPFSSAIIQLAKSGRTSRAAYRLAHERNIEADRVGLLQFISIIALEQGALADDATVANASIKTLATMRTLRSLPVLRKIAISSSEARYNAIAALAELSDAESGDSLKKYFEKAEDPQEISALASTLNSLGHAEFVWQMAGQWIKSDDTEIRGRGLLAFSKAPNPAVEEELLKTFAEASDDKNRSAAALALGGLLSTSLLSNQAIIGCLKDSNQGIREACFLAMLNAAEEGYRSPQAYGRVRPGLNDDVAAIRNYAAQSMSLFDPVRFARDVSPKNESSPELLKAIIDALAKNNSNVATAKLIQLAEHPKASIRTQALRALRGRDDQAARDTIFKHLVEDEDTEVRVQALAASDDILVIEEYLGDPDAGVKSVALTRWIELSTPDDFVTEFSNYIANAKNTAERSYWATLWLGATKKVSPAE